MSRERSAVIVLDYPAQLGDRELAEITMRRPSLDDEIRFVPTAREIRKQLEEEAVYFARLCGLTLEEIKKLDMADYEKVQAQYLLFRGKATVDSGSENDGSGTQPLGADAAQ